MAEHLCGQVNYKSLDEDERKLLMGNRVHPQPFAWSPAFLLLTLSIAAS